MLVECGKSTIGLVPTMSTLVGIAEDVRQSNLLAMEEVLVYCQDARELGQCTAHAPPIGDSLGYFPECKNCLRLRRYNNMAHRGAALITVCSILHAV